MRFDRVLGQLLLVGLGGVVVFSCSSNSDTPSGAGGMSAGTAGVAATGGSSGSSGAGGDSGGSSGSGGSSSGASGSSGNSSGGSAGSGSGSGGSAGKAGGGNGGTGGKTAICGDKVLDPGEQCDDGNTTSGDGCSSTCRSEACDKCVSGMAVPDQQKGCALVDMGIDAGDPAADMALCEEILQCTRDTKCVGKAPADFDDPSMYCFCGSLSQTSCFMGLIADPNNPPNGPCATEVLKALPAGSPPVAFGGIYFDVTNPVGAAMGRALGENNFCSSECGLVGAAGAGP